MRRHLNRWALLLALSISLIMCGTLYAQEPVEDEGGPRVLAILGTEHQNGGRSDGEMLLRGGGGIEWPGIFGWDAAYFMGEYTKIGWGDSDVEDEDRWHYAIKLYLSGYWENANPFTMLGVEHSGSSLIVGQRNVTWFGVGIEPEFAHGWLRLALEGTGWLMEDPNCWRFCIDLIPSNL